MPLPFLQRGPLSDHSSDLPFEAESYSLSLAGLQVGVDNTRYDVWISPKAVAVVRQHLARLIAHHGEVKDLVAEQAVASAAAPAWSHAKRLNKTLEPEPPEFKRLVTELLLGSLESARAVDNISVDVLARLALLKLLRLELGLQFAAVLERCREKLNSAERSHSAALHDLQEHVSRLQIFKQAVMRKTGQEIFTTLREIEKESLARTRRAYFGDSAEDLYKLFTNRLVMTKDGRDDAVNAEQYLLLGAYDGDPDRFSYLNALACELLREMNPRLDDCECEAVLNVPQNVEHWLGPITDAGSRSKVQRQVLEKWTELLDRNGVLQYLIAGYEATTLLSRYAPLIGAQQLKRALVSRSERKHVEELLDQHGKIAADALVAASRRVEDCRSSDRARIAARVLNDFARYHRDLRRFEALIASLEQVNLISSPKLRELSAVNCTLYEFLLREERGSEAKNDVVRHVIVKADVRDSTKLTRGLYDAGLNPASYFSLNFFDPITKLLPKYNAAKVFIEGDAVILSILQHQQDPQVSVARACSMAREMVEIVRAYNHVSQSKGLPSLEIGIGITAQDGAPLYLLDGTRPIMISQALNDADRLSSCGRGLPGTEPDSPFHVFVWESADGTALQHNVSGIRISNDAFEVLSRELSLQPLQGTEEELFHGIVPIGADSFRDIIIRRGEIGSLEDAVSTGKAYFEVCADDRLYAALERPSMAAAHA